jgi:hypothetical protein
MRELAKKFPFTSIACVVIAALVFQSLQKGRDSVITNAIIQVGWCWEADYICLLGFYFCFALILLLFGLTIDFGIKAYARPIVMPTPTKNQIIESPPEIF